jgi:hypothetical protein
MAQLPSSSSSDAAPVTEQAFLAERQKFFAGFGNATLGAVIFLAILMILMWIFLA